MLKRFGQNQHDICGCWALGLKCKIVSFSGRNTHPRPQFNKNPSVCVFSYFWGVCFFLCKECMNEANEPLDGSLDVQTISSDIECVDVRCVRKMYCFKGLSDVPVTRISLNSHTKFCVIFNLWKYLKKIKRNCNFSQAVLRNLFRLSFIFFSPFFFIAITNHSFYLALLL